MASQLAADPRASSEPSSGVVGIARVSTGSAAQQSGGTASLSELQPGGNLLRPWCRHDLRGGRKVRVFSPPHYLKGRFLAKTGGVAPDEPTSPANWLKTKDRIWRRGWDSFPSFHPPINDLGPIKSPQTAKSTQNLSIRYKTSTANPAQTNAPRDDQPRLLDTLSTTRKKTLRRAPGGWSSGH